MEMLFQKNKKNTQGNPLAVQWLNSRLSLPSPYQQITMDKIEKEIKRNK